MAQESAPVRLNHGDGTFIFSKILRICASLGGVIPEGITPPEDLPPKSMSGAEIIAYARSIIDHPEVKQEIERCCPGLGGIRAEVYYLRRKIEELEKS